MQGDVTRCGLCGSENLFEMLDMGNQPLAEAMQHEGDTDYGQFPLKLIRCSSCRLVQLSYIVHPGMIFKPDHPYATGNTKALRRHFSELAQGWSALLQPGDLVVDIGANDGTLLAEFGLHHPELRLVAVEPTRQAIKAAERGIDTYQEFFTPDLAMSIARKHGRAALILATNVLAHVPDPHRFMSGVRSMMTTDTAFVTENHDWGSVVNGLQIDTVYHEHLRYWTPATIGRLMEMHELLVVASTPIPTHGGSFRVTAKAENPAFRTQALAAAVQLETLVRTCAQKGKIYGVGAATRATPIMWFSSIAKYLNVVCEVKGSEKIGLCMPGTQVPVVDEERLLADQPPFALLFSWHLANDLIPKLREGGYKGKFIVPLPEPRLVDD